MSAELPPPPMTSLPPGGAAEAGIDPRELPPALRKSLLAIFADAPRAERVRSFASLADRVDDLARWYVTDRGAADRIFLRAEMTYGLAGKVKALRRAVAQRANDIAVGDTFGVAPVITVGRSLEDLASPTIHMLGRRGPGAHLVDAARVRRLFVPYGYELCVDGVYVLAPTRDGVDIRRVRICPRPMFVAGQSMDLATGLTRMVLAWPENAGRQWIACDVRRDIVMDARQIVQLSAHGAPVTSANRHQAVRYLSEFERANPNVPTRVVSSRLGWVTDRPSRADGSEEKDPQEVPRVALRGFLFPDRYMPVPRRPQPPMAAMGTTKKPRKPPKTRQVVFAPLPGVEQELAGLRRGGTWEGWCRAAQIAGDYPLVMLALYAACASPLLEVLGVPNFIVDFSDATSSGKTTATRFAASAMGSPDEHGAGVVYSWDETSAWIENVAGALYSLPLVLDDTKRADSETIGKTIFDFAQGRGRGRGSISGVRPTLSWRSVLLSTGESPLYEFVRMAGARARTLCIQGRPLGPAGDKNRAAAEEVGAIIDNHYGWLMPRVVEFLLAREAAGEWPVLKDAFVTAKRDFVQAGLARDGVGARQAQYVAALKVAQSIVHAVGTPRPKPENDPIAKAMEAAFAMVVHADVPKVAFEEMLGWCAANQQTFWGRHRLLANGRPIDPPKGGWSGVWTKSASWDWLYIRSTVVRQMLLLGGHVPADVLRRWADRKFVVGERGREDGTRSVKIDGVPARCYCIPREVFDETMSMDDDSEDEDEDQEQEG